MHDPLLTRAQLLIEEGRSLRERRRVLIKEKEEKLFQLRLARLECAMTRAEIKARRDDKRSLLVNEFSAPALEHIQWLSRSQRICNCRSKGGRLWPSPQTAILGPGS